MQHSPLDADLQFATKQKALMALATDALMDGTPSQVRRAAELSREAAGVAAERARAWEALAVTSSTVGALPDLERALASRVAYQQESEARCFSLQALLRCGEYNRAAQEAELAVESATRSRDRPQQVESLLARALAVLHTQGARAAHSINLEALRLCDEASYDVNGAGELNAVSGQHRLRAAEASARSNVARSLYGMGSCKEAIIEQRRALSLRRDWLLRQEALGDSEAIKEGSRRLASTASNLASMLCTTEEDELVAEGRALLRGEALAHARRSGDPRVEQSVLTNLVNCSHAEGAPFIGAPAVEAPTSAAQRSDHSSGFAQAVSDQATEAAGAGDGGAAALQELRQVLTRTGRQVEASTTCTVCLESLDREPAKVVALGCGHIFHRRCVERWARQSALCPSGCGAAMAPQ